MFLYLFFSFLIFEFHSLTVTIGNGSTNGCTNASLSNAITQILTQTNPKSSVLPHIINFSCGSSPVKIDFDAYYFISTSLLIDGTGNDITFDGQSKTRFFVVGSKDTTWGVTAADCYLLLTNIKFINGKGNDLPQARRPGYGNPQVDSSGNFINPVLKQDGGAIYVGSNGVLNINSCSFSNCQSNGTLAEGGSAPDDITYDGGAIMVLTQTNLTITNSQFINCVAKTEGGAIYVFWQATTVNISNSVFQNNSAYYTGEGGGGAIRLHESQLNVKNTTFSYNQATLGSAISNLLSDLDVDGCVFDNNKAINPLGLNYDARAAIYIDGARANTKGAGHITINNSTFTRNWSGEKGGGVYVCPYGGGSGDQVSFQDVFFCNNTVQGNLLNDGNTHNYGAGFSCDCGASNTNLYLKNVYVGGNDVINKTGASSGIQQYFISNNQIPVTLQGNNVLSNGTNDQSCPNYVFSLIQSSISTNGASNSTTNSTSNSTIGNNTNGNNSNGNNTNGNNINVNNTNTTSSNNNHTSYNRKIEILSFMIVLLLVYEQIV